MTITILKTEQFQPLGKPLPRPSTTPAPEPVQIKPGVLKGADGKFFTDFSTGQSVTPAPKAPESPLPVQPNALKVGCRIRVIEDINYFSCGNFSVGDCGTVVLQNASGWLVCFDASDTVSDDYSWTCEAANKPRHWFVRGDDVEVIQQEAAAPAAALGDGWIDWHGGECPIDLPCKWQLRHRNGKEFDSDIDPRGYSAQWRHASPDRGAHIVAYRLLPKEPA